MGGDGNQGGADKLKWAEKIEISVIDPPTIREGRVQNQFMKLYKMNYKSEPNLFKNQYKPKTSKLEGAYTRSLLYINHAINMVFP